MTLSWLSSSTTWKTVSCKSREESKVAKKTNLRNCTKDGGRRRRSHSQVSTLNGGPDGSGESGDISAGNRNGRGKTYLEGIHGDVSRTFMPSSRSATDVVERIAADVLRSDLDLINVVNQPVRSLVHLEAAVEF